MNDARLQAHVDDGALVRLMDGALHAPAAARVEAHLDACEPCTARLAELRERSAALRELLAGEPAAAPDAWLRPALEARRRRRASWWRGPRGMAAAAAALFVLALLAPPVYGAVRRWVAARLAPVASAPASRPSGAPPAPARARDAVRFTPATAELHLRFAEPDASAVLALAPTTGAEARLSVERAAGAPPPVLVLPDGIDVQNRATPGATYRLLVPASVREVRVTVAGRAVAVVRGIAEGESRVVKLAARRD